MLLIHETTEFVEEDLCDRYAYSDMCKRNFMSKTGDGTSDLTVNSGESVWEAPPGVVDRTMQNVVAGSNALLRRSKERR